MAERIAGPEIERLIRQAFPDAEVVVIDTDPLPSTAAGGAWWDVAVPEVSVREEVRKARQAYEVALKQQRVA